MALKKIPVRPQLEEPGNMGHFTEGSGSKTKLHEASENHFFPHRVSHFSPLLCPYLLILKRKYVI